MTNENIKPENLKKPTRLRYIIPIVFLLLCLLVGLTYRTITWPSLDSKSQKLSESIIRQTVSKIIKKGADKLNDQDFATIESFGTDWLFQNGEWVNYSEDFSDIKLLEKFINLRELTLSSMALPEDALPQLIKYLAKIGIDRRQNYLIDLSPLEKLPNLTKLNLSNTSFKDIRTITGIKNLQELNISNTLVYDLEPIKKLKKLKRLDISNCDNISDKQIEDLQKVLPNLEIER